MKRKIRNPLKFRVKKLSGLLVPAPSGLREENIVFLLIGEDGREYRIKENRKAYKMWNLVDTQVELTGVIMNKGRGNTDMRIITFKCIDDFIDTDSVYTSYEDYDFDPSRFDYAI
jgi:hypothetical protein